MRSSRSSKTSQFHLEEPFGGKDFKTECRSELLLDSVKTLCREGLLETAFDHAYQCFLCSSEEGVKANCARFELGVIALNIHQNTSSVYGETDKVLVDQILVEYNKGKEELPSHLLVAAHALLALNFNRTGPTSRNIEHALTHVVLSHRYSELNNDPEIASIGRVTNLLNDAANTIVETKLMYAKEKAWKLFVAGDGLSAYETVTASLRSCAFVGRLDPVACKSSIAQKDSLLLLGMFFAHQSGDWDKLEQLAPKKFRVIHEPSVRAACKLIFWSAMIQKTDQKLLPAPSADTVRLFKYFIMSATPLVLMLGVTAFHSLAINYTRRNQFREGQVILTGIIEALSWEEMRNRFEDHSTDLLASSYYSRAQSNYFQKHFTETQKDLVSSLNLMGHNHCLRAPTEFASAFMLHCAAMRQYWLRLSSSDAGAPFEFLQDYIAAQKENLFLSSFEPLGQLRAWSDYADEAESKYKSVLSHARNPNLLRDSQEKIIELRNFRAPKQKSPFGKF